MYILLFFGHFFANIFTTSLDFANKNQFFKFAIFADSKSKEKELYNNVSFVIFGHQTLN